MQLFLADRSSVDAAQELIATFGDDAGFEAAARADKAATRATTSTSAAGARSSG